MDNKRSLKETLAHLGKFPRELWSKAASKSWDSSRLQKHMQTRDLVLRGFIIIGVILFVLGLVVEMGPGWNEALIGIGGVFVGTGSAVWVSGLLSTEVDLINIVAEGMVQRGLLSQEELRPYQKKWRFFHVTRTSEGHGDIGRGFFWIHYDLDLSSPVPGKLLGIARTVDPRGSPESSREISFIVEGFVHEGTMITKFFPCQGRESITATFTFPYLRPPNYSQFGIGTCMTYAGAQDVITGCGILSPAECSFEKPIVDSAAPGRLTDDIGRLLEKCWWEGYRLKLLPRLLPQVSLNYARVPDLSGKWIAQYLRVYSDSGDWFECEIEIRATGPRILIWSLSPHKIVGNDGNEHPDNRGWVAECTAVHDFSLQGRWWGVKIENRADSPESLAMTKIEGGISLSVYEDFEGLVGFFTGRPGSRSRAISPIVLVREDVHRKAGDALAELRTKFVERARSDWQLKYGGGDGNVSKENSPPETTIPPGE